MTDTNKAPSNMAIDPQPRQEVQLPPMPREAELLAKIDQLQSQIAAAVAAEREACAARIREMAEVEMDLGHTANAGLLDCALGLILDRTDTDALDAYRRQVRAEALREAISRIRLDEKVGDISPGTAQWVVDTIATLIGEGEE